MKIAGKSQEDKLDFTLSSSDCTEIMRRRSHEESKKIPVRRNSIYVMSYSGNKRVRLNNNNNGLYTEELRILFCVYLTAKSHMRNLKLEDMRAHCDCQLYYIYKKGSSQIHPSDSDHMTKMQVFHSVVIGWDFSNLLIACLYLFIINVFPFSWN